MEADGKVTECSEGNGTFDIIITKWNARLAAENEEEKREKLYEAIMFLLGSYLSADKPWQSKVLEFRDPRQVANAVAEEFIAATYRQCSNCDEDGLQVLDYFRHGSGLTTMLGLVLYAEKVSSCCSEICDLLLSLIPLSFETIEQENRTYPYQELPENILLNAQPVIAFKNSLQKLLMGSINIDIENVTEGSSDDMPVSFNDVQTVCKMLREEMLKNNDILICLLSSLLGILLSETVKSNITFKYEIAHKAINLLKSSDSSFALPTAFQFSLIIRLPCAMLIERLSLEGVGWLIDSSAFKDLVGIGQRFFNSAISGNCKASLEVVMKVSSILTAVWSLLFWGMSASVKAKYTSELSRIFLECEIYGLTESVLKYFLDVFNNKNATDNNTTDLEESYLKLKCINCFITPLTKIAKKFKRIEQDRCCRLTSKINVTRKARKKLSGSFKRPFNREANSSSGSEKETCDAGSLKENESDGTSSTQDMSDYALQTSDSDDAKQVKSQHKRHPSNASFREEKRCFVGSLVTLFVSLHTECESPEFKEKLLDTISETGICSCMNQDQFFSNILAGVERQSGALTAKSLDVIADVLQQMQMNAQKTSQSTSKTRSSFKKRDISHASKVESHISTQDGDTTDSAVEGFLFLQKYKNLIKSSNKTIKDLFALHLDRILPIATGYLRWELLRKIVIPIFLHSCPFDGKDFDIIIDPSNVLLVMSSIAACPLIFENEELLQLFVQKNGLWYLERLGLDLQIGPTALRALHLLVCSHTQKIASSSDDKCVKISKEVPIKNKGSSKSLKDLSTEATSVKAIEALLACGTKFFEEKIESSESKVTKESWVAKQKDLSIALSLLNIYNELLFSSSNFKKEFIKGGWPLKCFKLLKNLLKIAENATGESRIEVCSAELLIIVKTYLEELRRLLVLCFKFSGLVYGEEEIPSIKKILEMLLNSFMHHRWIDSTIGKDICAALLQCSFDQSNQCTWPYWKDSQEPADSQIEDEANQEVEDPEVDGINLETEGYDADTESEFEFSMKSSECHSRSPKRTAILSNFAFSDQPERTGVPENSEIQFPDVCMFVLDSLANFVLPTTAHDGKLRAREALVFSLNSIWESIDAIWSNCSILSNKGLLKLLLEKFDFFFRSTSEEYREIRDVIAQIAVLLSACSITASEFKTFLEFFKDQNASIEFLSDVLRDIASVGYETAGATNALIFPLELENETAQKRGKLPLLQRSQTFLIPKKDVSSGNRSILRQRSISGCQLSGPGPKSYGYRCQAPSMEIAPVQLPLEDHFTWPDKGFSISIWFQIHDNRCCSFVYKDSDGNAGHGLAKKKCKPKSHHATDSNAGTFNDIMVFHLCSFGSLNALFEVWIGTNPRNLEYRWLVSQWNDKDGKLSNFDQVILPVVIPPNQWNHLVVTLTLPQNLKQPHTAKVNTFLNGCEQSTVNMKFPSRVIQSNCKLTAMIGHGVKKSKLHSCTTSDLDVKLHIGNLMIFQGNESFMSQQRSSRERGKSEKLVGKLEAVYLFALGPDSSYLSSECHDHFSVPFSSHMDSSLNWDSMHFKELSFAMNVISEQLVASGCPSELLIDTKRIVPIIESFLQDCLLIKYSSNHYSEFCQYVLRRKRSISSPSTKSSSYFQLLRNKADITAVVQPYRRLTLQQAVHDTGGMASLLLLFAKISEDEDLELAQSLMLNTLFLVVEKSSYLLREMNDLAGYVLIHRVLESSPCQFGFHMVKALLTSMCHGELFLEPKHCNGGFLQILPSPTAVVKNISILQIIIMDWKLWDKTPLSVQELLWLALESLVRQNHPFDAFNVLQFKRARVVEQLLIGCQERQQHHNKLIPPILSQLYISVIKNLLGQPPDMPILKAICSFLIAVHPTVDTLTLHSKSNFYLLPKVPSVNYLKHLEAKSSYNAASQRRTQSFTEGLSMRNGSFSKSLTGDSIISVYSNVISSVENSPSEKEEFVYPKSEVLFRKDHMKRYLSERIDECYSENDKSNEDLKLDVETRPRGYHSTPTKPTSNKAIDETDLYGLPMISIPANMQDTRKKLMLGDLNIDSVNERISNSQHLQNSNKPRLATVPRNHSSRKSHEIAIPTHRRNRSLDVNLTFSSTLTANLDSQEYDIISDSELPSSLDRCSDEYLVVDGFISQKVGSFTPSAPGEKNKENDVLYHLRLGLFEILQEVLILLPDNLVTRSFGSVLKVEHLLVLVSQQNDRLREIAVKNLVLYLRRGGRVCIDNFKRFMGFHLLANQLHQYRSTVELGNSCFNLLTGKSVDLQDQGDWIKNLSAQCPAAMVAYIALLEDSVQQPQLCHVLISGLIEVFKSIKDLVLFVFDQGLAEVICNMVCILATSDHGSMTSKWKQSVFKDLLQLICWIMEKSCKTCEPEYFQIFKDLFLAIEMLESKEREKKAPSSNAIVKCARFVQYYVIQSALELFKSTGLYPSSSSSRSHRSVSDHSDDHSPSATRRPSMARAFINRLRSSMHVTTSPSVASPGEIQERFVFVIAEAVNLGTIFNKGAWVCESVIFGKELKDLCDKHLGVDEQTSGGQSSFQDADHVFCANLFHFLLDSVSVATDIKAEKMNWAVLLRATKEELVIQTGRLFIYLLAPLRPLDVRFNAIRQLTERIEAKRILQTLLHGISGIKNRERLLSCAGSCLKYTKEKLNDHQLKARDAVKNLIKMLKLEIVDVPEQQLYQEIREIKTRRQKQVLNRRKEVYKRKTDSSTDISKAIESFGLEVTKVVVEEQDRQRQKLLQLVRGAVSKKVEIRKLWRKLIHHLTQERAPWSECPENCSPSWQLDPTEGPCRIRTRLQRCHTDVPRKFFLPDSKMGKVQHSEQLLSYLFAENDNEDEPTYYTFKTNDTIRFHYHCYRVLPDAKMEGDVLIGETHMYFVGEEFLIDPNVSQVFGDKDVISISWRYEEIKEILKRRYSLQDNAVEIFLTSGRTFLLAFEDTTSRNEVFEQLMSRELPNLVINSVDLNALTTRWRDGQITNFEYLTELNKKAGRSFNDLMQYPVFPFILSDYEGHMLDLTDQSSFRDLAKPIAVQHGSKEEKYLEMYNWLEEDYERKLQEDTEEATPPYHYGSHYSNSGTVLHFLVRLPPFTKMFLIYQDNQFDIPDRTFHSVLTTWQLSSFASSSDVKELIPEFFFLPEFLENAEGYNFGCRQNGKTVCEVNLPPWTPQNNARLFVNIHRQALESQCVSASLHNWIDLVFGYKQDGAAARKAINVFHPATYFGVDVNAAKDPVKRRAVQTMIETYGQTPRKLFNSPHIQRFSKVSMSPLTDMIPTLPQAVENLISPASYKDRNWCVAREELEHSGIQPLPTVAGLIWGRYCGSPSQSKPTIQWVESFDFSPNKIVASSSSLVAWVLKPESCLLLLEEHCRDEKRIASISWGHADNFLTVKHFPSNTEMLFDASRPDKITCCEFVPGAELLFIGGESGIISVWPVKLTNDPMTLDITGAKENLLAHTGAISNIAVCRPFSIVVSGSYDCTAVIWDLNRLSYVRSLPKHQSAITCIALSRTSGNIATANEQEGNGSLLNLWTINAKEIWSTSTESKICCVDFSCAAEGISVNVVAAGLQNGTIRLWSTWTLMCIRDIMPLSNPCEIVCLAYSPWDPEHLFSCDGQGKVSLWTKKELQVKPTFVPVMT